MRLQKYAYFLFHTTEHEIRLPFIVNMLIYRLYDKPEKGDVYKSRREQLGSFGDFDDGIGHDGWLV